MIGLPTPRLTATISPPGHRKHDLGAVVVHGYTPPAGEPADPRAKKLKATASKRSMR